MDDPFKSESLLAELTARVSDLEGCLPEGTEVILICKLAPRSLILTNTRQAADALADGQPVHFRSIGKS